MDARDMMQKYQIGVLEGKKKVAAKPKAKDDTSTNNESKSSLLRYFYILYFLLNSCKTQSGPFIEGFDEWIFQKISLSSVK
jgi:hypothetical protein